MKGCRWKSFFENPKPVVSNVEPSAIQKAAPQTKMVGAFDNHFRARGGLGLRLGRSSQRKSPG